MLFLALRRSRCQLYACVLPSLPRAEAEEGLFALSALPDWSGCVPWEP